MAGKLKVLSIDGPYQWALVELPESEATIEIFFLGNWMRLDGDERDFVCELANLVQRYRTEAASDGRVLGRLDDN